MHQNQRYKCSKCNAVFTPKKDFPKWVKKAYFDYSNNRFILKNLALKYKKSTRTIRKYFDLISHKNSFENRPKKSLVNLIFDATFFTRKQGVLVFRANGKNIFYRIIDSEKICYIEESLIYLSTLGYRFKSFTIDGRKGVFSMLERLFPIVPIQLCQFHQAMIIRRYTTLNPQTECGIDLKILMKTLTFSTEKDFLKKLFFLSKKHAIFLKERNEKNQFMHRRLRSAFRSLKTNLKYLFTYKNHPELEISNTTNSCEGSFSHWKNKVKIHRGLRADRKNKMIFHLLEKS